MAWDAASDDEAMDRKSTAVVRPRRDVRGRMLRADITDWHELANDGLAIFRIRRADGAAFFDYQPGQHAQLAFADQPAHDPRPRAYSIASAPLDRSTLEFLVVLVNNALPNDDTAPGVFTGALWRHAPGDEVLYSGPAGRFTLDRTTQREVVCVATGTGLAPFVSMTRALHAAYRASGQAPRRLTLIHGVSYGRYLAYHDYLTDVAADRGFGLLYVPVISRPDGDPNFRPTMGHGRANDVVRMLLGQPRTGRVAPSLPPDVLAELHARLAPERTALYLCGNPEMIRDCKAVAAGAGFPDSGKASQIITEDYW